MGKASLPPLAILSGMALLALLGFGRAEPIEPGAIEVIDGDTSNQMARRKFWKLASSSSSAQNSEQYSLPDDERHA
jgi:hypothetical protein